MRVAAMVFDFDGLLMDTESVMLASWQYEWRQHGLDLDLASFWVNHGGDVTEDRYQQLGAAVGSSFDRNASHARRTAYRDDLNRRLGLRPGIDAWLDDGRGAGLRLAVASSSPTTWVQSLLAGIGKDGCFAAFACGDEVAHPKPSPEVYLLALDRLGVLAAEAVAVEDSPHGVAAAIAAGLRCIGIPNPHVAAESLRAADLVLASAADLSLARALERLQ
ncbi:MAG TPA: HAD-IA family hydrolase [Streptosporangiaceae bacterium]|nr:HAD-IA family hydrolase [Streptosporangiaceae bacterium]